jgi:hypothetical protein
MEECIACPIRTIHGEPIPTWCWTITASRIRGCRQRKRPERWFGSACGASPARLETPPRCASTGFIELYGERPAQSANMSRAGAMATDCRPTKLRLIRRNPVAPGSPSGHAFSPADRTTMNVRDRTSSCYPSDMADPRNRLLHQRIGDLTYGARSAGHNSRMGERGRPGSRHHVDRINAASA